MKFGAVFLGSCPDGDYKRVYDESLEQAQKILKLVDALEDNEDVQSVAHNAEIPESVTV